VPEPEPLSRESVASVPGRVILLGRAQLLILDSQNGKQRKDPIAVEKGARLVGADGRYLVIEEPKGLALIDVLGGQKTASIRGPASAVAALSAGAGVAIAFMSGDVIEFDRDGVVLDRDRVEGTPITMRRGSPLAPGPVVISTRGMWAFGDPPDASKTRDVEAMLKLSSALEALGQRKAALAMLDDALIVPRGRVVELESARAKLLRKFADKAHDLAAAWAEERAQAAKDPTKPLPRFRWFR
jgi:hypothetical protein